MYLEKNPSQCRKKHDPLITDQMPLILTRGGKVFVQLAKKDDK